MADVNAYRKAISEYFGFKEELIENVEPCGLWHVRFVVNHIRYYGYVAHAGAEPVLLAEGTAYEYYDRSLPVTKAYYDEFIAGKRLHVRYCVDPECGEWRDTGDVFDTYDDYCAFEASKHNPERYDFEYRD